jgi:hypothetical protein
LQTGEEARGSQRISASKRIRALAIMVSKLVDEGVELTS